MDKRYRDCWGKPLFGGQRAVSPRPPSEKAVRGAAWVARVLLCSCLTLLLFGSFPALAETKVERSEGEAYFPSEKNWVYHYTYAFPYLTGQDYTSALINDTYEMALDEMRQLVLPMFANSPDMRFDGKNEVTQDFSVVCNNGLLLSILQTKRQTRGSEGDILTLEPLTFDVSGMYAGESLTLRGVTLIQGGVDPAALEDADPGDYPALAHILDGSSGEMAQALLPLLYERFQSLQEEGVMAPALSQQDFEDAFSPENDFYTDENGNLVFFFPPMLMARPAFSSPTFSFSPGELDDLLAAYWGE